MGTLRLCKDCGRSIIVYSTLQNRCHACDKKRQSPIKQRKIKQVGDEGDRYSTWLHHVARPYLDNRFGRDCSVCGKPPPINDETGEIGWHHVDHIGKRGSHPQDKYKVTNVRFLCAECHQKVT